MKFFTWMCETIESCDYQGNHRTNMCPLYVNYKYLNATMLKGKCVHAIKGRPSGEYTITYSNVAAVECAEEEDIRSYW